MTENGQKHVDKPLENAEKHMRKWLKMDENHVDKPFENDEQHMKKWLTMDKNMWTNRSKILKNTWKNGWKWT